MVFENSSKIHCLIPEHQMQKIITDCLKERGITKPWTLERCDLSSACEGLRGYLGDHSKMSVNVCVDDELVTIKLFVKSIPMNNQPKVQFIEENFFFSKEMVMYKLFEEMGGAEGPQAWRPKVYMCTEDIVVMPDLSVHNYSQQSQFNPLDLQHVLATVDAIARFHAASFQLETTKGLTHKNTYTIIQGYEEIIKEYNFRDVPWLRASAKLTANILKTLSKKHTNFGSDLESTLVDLCVQACDSLKQYDDTINVLLHKDLWVNNIMYKYDGPNIKALLIDFQCARYGPPAFDLMTFLYLTTSREFRCYEEHIISHYYTTFMDNLHGCSKDKADSLGYSLENFRDWCETARMFGILEAMCIFPFILMDPKTGQKTFDDPEKYDLYMNIDRTEPVLAYAKISPVYQERNLQMCEEFYERYVLKK